MQKINTPRIAAFTQCYKEQVMLPLWVAHYSTLLGPENLLILDHNNDPPITIDGIKTAHIPRINFDEMSRLNLIKTWLKILLKIYDWVIFTDTDEFIIFRPSPSYLSIYEYLKKTTAPIIRCVGVEIIDTGNVPPINWEIPILPQRPKGILSHWSCKSSISSIPNEWTPGFHTTNSDAVLDNHFWLFHLKYADESYLMQRLAMTRQFEWSKESIKAKYGLSHRVSNKQMQMHLDHLRAKTANGTLDDYLKENPDINNIVSPVMDIPYDFINPVSKL